MDAASRPAAGAAVADACACFKGSAGHAALASARRRAAMGAPCCALPGAGSAGYEGERCRPPPAGLRCRPAQPLPLVPCPVPMPEASAPEAAPAGDAPHRAWRAVEVLYHALLTGLILAVITRCGEAAAAEVVFRTFRRQQQALFLPGLAKLGLRGLPDAVACAQYHYLSNAMGGVKVEYARESDRKAWVRYPPPRWIWAGTAACAVPVSVSAAMLRGWHAHNGVSLGNPRLGFVCTGQTVEGHPGLEGYYLEHERDLAPEERLRFSPGEPAPAYDPAAMPRPPAADWPPERLRKAMRNYAMAYVRTILPVTLDVLGPEPGGAVAAHAARVIGMQCYDELAALVNLPGTGAAAFADFLAALLAAQGEAVERTEAGRVPGLRMRGWRLLGDDPQAAAAFRAWNALWEGALAVHDRRLRLESAWREASGGPEITWRVVG
jgi:hypothetical protein